MGSWEAFYLVMGISTIGPYLFWVVMDWLLWKQELKEWEERKHEDQRGQ